MNTIFRNSPLPRYYQLKEIMREKILSGEWKPGDLIPSERELSEQYGISRMTARQAITELVNEGLFYREQGRGTFVSRNRITQQLTKLTGFNEDMRARGYKPGTKVLSARLWPADETVAAHLHIRPGDKVFRLHRLRMADDDPLALETSFVSFIGCEKLLEDDLNNYSLYYLLETKYGYPPLEADQELEAGLVGSEEARLLRIAVGSPVLYIRRTTYTERKQPIEYAASIYSGHKYTFYAHLHREQLISK
ncbi:GntR family transcriptional regulator [Thermosporothrix hazakensis]|jgi:GntR family transcriptional regulator|uniref:GntR family transcriptional regulator n=2 Tax=Thermosporothrix TaxID=768650 RepID=A0A326UHJ8_THEHA|nr:GntR family transcriptional regulator [Thermosporothrix hazakensis]PZW27420.1 GntR family transcriptional regulator [Thermosporothrix hazakensis]